jgi:hypothetical protein
MIGWGLQGTVPLPAGERLVPLGEARATGQAPSAPSGVGEFLRGRKVFSREETDIRKDDNKLAKDFSSHY